MESSTTSWIQLPGNTSWNWFRSSNLSPAAQGTKARTRRELWISLTMNDLCHLHSRGRSPLCLAASRWGIAIVRQFSHAHGNCGLLASHHHFHSIHQKHEFCWPLLSLLMETRESAARSQARALLAGSWARHFLAFFWEDSQCTGLGVYRNKCTCSLNSLPSQRTWALAASWSLLVFACGTKQFSLLRTKTEIIGLHKGYF